MKRRVESWSLWPGTTITRNLNCGLFQLEKGDGPYSDCRPPSVSAEGGGDNDSLMKLRITELLQALERVKRNGELRQQQQDEVINGLKKANS